MNYGTAEGGRKEVQGRSPEQDGQKRDDQKKLYLSGEQVLEGYVERRI